MVKANRAWLRKDAALQHELEQIRGGGAVPAAGGGVPAGPGGEEMPPDMGPAGAPGGEAPPPEPVPTPGGETSALPA